MSENVKEGKVSVDVSVKIAEKADKDDDGSDKGKDAGIIGLNIPRGLGPGGRSSNIYEFPALQELRNANLCLLKEGRRPMRILFRSPERMVRYLGDIVAVQTFGVGTSKGPIQILNDAGVLVDLFRVERGRDLLGNGAAVSVEGPEREHVFIPIPEHKSGNAHLSLQALALVMESFNQAVSGKSLPQPATIFLSGG